ncbi:MAG: hypoxanthine phosphoribosyltransferase [Candidatus Cloacimonetes bacterium]|nr:hypoxanthine phosphoribosyltransferase [Candidatus Cloacimonadota bacterium]
MSNDISAILLDEETIQKRISELAACISKDYEDKSPVIISVLKGSFIFLADLVRSFTIPVEIDFLAISSYGSSTVSSGVVSIKKDLDIDVSERDVIIVEDIVDSGLSLKYIVDYIEKHHASSVKTCVLLDKPSAHQDEIKIDYKGFDIGNDFVVGYGLDFAEKYRNLPYVAILKEEVYK